ncbi:hypothetical protein LCM17_01775 [Cereibacter sphaeroides]|nr:hypothetical protein [Cereibacter sphaeroides]
MPQRRPLLRLWALLLIPLLALLAGAAALALTYWLRVAPFRGESFDVARWHDAQRCDPQLSPADCQRQQSQCLRGPMVEDLVENHLQRARSDRTATRQFLGPPTRTGALTLADRQFDDCDFYPLGACSLFGVDESQLYICFTADQTIDRAGPIRP